LPQSVIRRTYPNPSAGDTNVDFFLEAVSVVELDVYDVAGRRVRTLFVGTLPAGEHAARWDGRDASGSAVPSGAYFIRLKVGGVVVASRAILVR